MNQWLTNVKFTTISTFFLAAFVANVFIFKIPAIGIILLFFMLALITPTIGRAAAPKEARSTQFVFGLFVLLSVIALIGSLFYYLSSFSALVAVVIVLLAPSTAWLLKKRAGKSAVPASTEHDPLIELPKKIKVIGIAAAIIISALTITVILIINSATENAVRSPWTIISPMVFLTFGLAIILIVALLLKAQERALIIPLVSFGLFVFLSVTLLVFPIGYGFDSFIHQATENHIAEFGTITPKPFYYIGQYSMILFLHYAFLIPVEWADKLLLPILASLFLPFTWLTAATHLLKEKKAAIRSLIFLFLIPLSSFIVTTPQGLGNLWFFLIILLSIPRLIDRNNLPIWPLILGAIVTLLIHPIAGIPAILFIALLSTDNKNEEQRFPRLAKIFSWLVILFGGLALPATFIINNLRSGQSWGFNFSGLAPTSLFQNLHLDLFFENRFLPILDFVYFFGWNQILILVVGTIIGLVWMIINDRQNKGANDRSPLQIAWIYIAMAVILFINFIVTAAAVDFSFLIDYERGNYAARLIPLIIFCLVPFIIIFAGKSLTKIQEKPTVLKLTSIILLTALITAAFYFNYPRKDAYETNHGFNVSQADIAAVRDVDHDAVGHKYIVLANQSTSAAAISQFGFTNYYDNQFYYPIPTGGTLYQLFLTMNEHPTRETALAAMDLLGVERVYYLVSDYWWQADRITETAKTTADKWWSVEEEKVMIFEYEK